MNMNATRTMYSHKTLQRPNHKLPAHIVGCLLELLFFFALLLFRFELFPLSIGYMKLLGVSPHAKLFHFRLSLLLFLLQGNDKTKKKNAKAVELPMEISTHGFNPENLGNYTQQEVKMIANDLKETERIDAKNALEEFVYDARNKLQVIILF